MDASFHGGSNETIGGRVQRRRPEIWFEGVYPSSGASNQEVWGVSGMRFFMVVPMTPSAAASDLGGRRYCCILTEASLFWPSRL
jgi:hypothetical protein